MDKKDIVIVDATETFTESLYKDALTFGLLILCIFISYGSWVWSLVVAFMFLAFLFSKSSDAFTHKFSSYDEVIEWAESKKAEE